MTTDLLSRPLADLLDEHAAERHDRITAAINECAAALPVKEVPAPRRTTPTKLRPVYELAVRLESQGTVDPDPRATETEMLVAIEYALGTLADQRDHERGRANDAVEFARSARRSA